MNRTAAPSEADLSASGLPHGTIAQIAYIVPDVEAAMRSGVARLNVAISVTMHFTARGAAHLYT